MQYLTSLRLPVSPPQWLEVLVVLSTVDFLWHTIASVKSFAVISESKAGRIRPDSMPPTFMGRIITPIHGLATFVPPLVYIGVLVLNGFQQPEWLAKCTLSAELGNSTWGNALRVIACIASFASRPFMDTTLKHLGDQWHAIGVSVELAVILPILISCNSVVNGLGWLRPVLMHGFVIRATGTLSKSHRLTRNERNVVLSCYKRRCGLSCSGRTYPSWPLVSLHLHLRSKCRSRYLFD